MASAGDRLQIVIGAKDELTAELRQTRKELTQLGRTANDVQRRMENGEQGLQGELEQTRREIQRVTAEHKDLSRKQSEVNREFRDMTTNSRRAGTQMTSSMDRAGREMGITSGKAHKLEQATGRMRTGWAKFAGIAAAVTGAVYAASGAFSMLSGSIEEARGARKALAQTGAVLRSMGRKESAQGIETMLNQLSRMSGIDDDNLREMSNTLLTFGNVSGDTFTTANKLALDLSVAFGKDLQSSAIMVGKALNDPLKGLTALSRIGVQFTSKQQDQIKAMMAVNDVAGAQKIIMGELKRQVGGSAAAQADAIDKAGVAWKNLKEAIGEVLLSTGTGFDLVGVIEDATKWIKANKDTIVSVLQKIISVIFKVISAFLKWESIVIKGIGYMIGAYASLVQAMAWLDPSLQDNADSAKRLADQFGDTSAALDSASKFFDRLSRGADDASRSTKNLKDKLDSVGVSVDKLNRKQVNDLLRDTPVPGVNRQGGIPALFAGGAVMAGQTALVGEIGPELFVPNAGDPRMVGVGGPEVRDFHTSGTIIPNVMIGTYMAAQAASSGGAASAPSGGVHIENLTVQDKFDARREFAAMMARERRIAAERS